MKHQELAYNVSGQSLVFDCPEGRPSTVTSLRVWRAEDDDDGPQETFASGSPAIETTPNTTVDVASGAGNLADRTRVNLTATTGVARGREYRLTDTTTGAVELVEVREIVSGDYVRARVPLMNPYAVGSTFQSTRITQAVLAAWLQDEDNISADWCPGSPGYRARIEYVIGFETYVHYFYFDLVRCPLHRLVTPLDVDRRFPGWINSLPVDYRSDQGASLVQAACDALVMDALGDAKELRQVRESRVLHELVCCRAMLSSAEANALAGSTRVEQLEAARTIYDQRYNQLLREPKVPIDEGEGGAGAPARRLPLWSR